MLSYTCSNIRTVISSSMSDAKYKVNELLEKMLALKLQDGRLQDGRLEKPHKMRDYRRMYRLARQAGKL